MKTKRLRTFNLIVVLTMLLSLLGMGAIPPAGKAAALGEAEAVSAMPAPLIEFAGQSRGAPDAENEVPDTSGDAGRTRYIQAVNEAVQIFYKDGTPVTGSVLFEDFWYEAGTGTSCDGGTGNHRGQPNVLYDEMSQRWFIIDLAYADSEVDNGPYFFCIAVSNGDAGERVDEFNSNDWYFYTLQTTEREPYYLPDQPRAGLWHDGIYIAADMYDVYNNGYNRTPKGVKVWALNRDDLVSHTNIPPNPFFRYVDFHMPEGLGYHGLLPANFRGMTPAADTPAYFTAIAPPNRLYLWKFYVDWIDMDDGSTFSFTPTTLYTQTGFAKAVGHIVPQPGTTNKLDILGDRLSSVFYREVEGIPALWASHTVLNPGGGTDLRWYEVRGLDDIPFFYQEGAYNPDTRYRWISSLAVDGEGNMAIGYSRSSSSSDPSIYYAGRLVNDPLGELAQGEALLYPGSEYQDIVPANNDEPWGRKSSMTVDPVDDCIFWYTNEYYSGGENGGPTRWLTRIGWFRFPSCKAGTTARISLHTDGTQGNGPSGDPLEPYSVSSSHSGRWVAFTSDASNLVDDDTNGVRDVFVRDRDTDADGIFDEPGGVKTTRLSLSTAGVQGNKDSWEVSISYDGRFVAFSSDASNLIGTGNDTNGARDIFVRDRDTDRDGKFDEPGAVSTFRVSIPDGGGQSNARSDQPSIALFYYDYDKCDLCPKEVYLYVAYRSVANNLVDDDTNVFSDIFVYVSTPWGTGTERASEDSFGLQANGNSYTPAIAANYWSDYIVTFASDADNLVAGDGNGYTDVFLRYRWTGQTTRVSVDSFGVEGDGASFHPAISGDGTFVAFISQATNLVTVPPLDTNGVADVFLHDTIFDTTERISVSFIGAEANADSYTPSLSWEGQYIAFASEANNLDLVIDTNGVRDIFLHDHATGLTKRVSNGYNGEADGLSVAPAISGDGRHVAYPSFATNLVTNDTNNVWDVFAHDREGIIPTFLTVGSNVPGTPGMQVSVPLYFTGYGQSIDATTFSIDFDEECLTYNSTTFSLPAGFEGFVTPDLGDKDGELDFNIKATSANATLPDGTLLAMTFTVKNHCQTAPDTSRSARVGFSKFPQASFGKNTASIPGKTADGFVEIFDGTPGDCNADGVVEAGDISALVLEIFDGDGDVPANTPKGTFKGNAVGCNPNGDIVVDAGDISALLPIIFTSSPFSALEAFGPAAGKPVLSMPMMVRGSAKERLAVPITFQSNGNPVNVITFAVEWDPAKLALTADDIQFSLPGNVTAQVVNPDYANGYAGFFIMAPQGTVADGGLATLDFSVEETVVGTDTVVVFSNEPEASFGGNAQSAPGETLDARLVRKLFIPALHSR